jgi:hypothetical protein
MIKLLNAYTQALDDSEKAVREILEPLDIKNSLLKNSVALLFCHVKFIETGAAEAVYKSLPFDVLGFTTQYFGLPMTAGAPTAADTPAVEGGVFLTVTILTSDDIDFTVGISDPLNEGNVGECVQELYRRAASAPGAPPSGPPSGSPTESPTLAFAFLPTMLSVPGDVMAASLDLACGGIPIFGTLALDIQTSIRCPKTIFKAYGQAAGESGDFSDRIALLLFRGSVKPRFFHSSFPKKSILSLDAVITEASGSRIISINNKPALSFIKDLGFLSNSMRDNFIVYPLVVEYPNNGTQVVVVQGIDPEGHLLCSMNVQTGGILNIGAITADAVLESAKSMAQDLKKDGGGTGFIMFSCFLRNVVLGGSSQAEFELICKELGGYTGSCLFLNSGGELCPGYTENGELVNRFHQYALIACQF